MWTDGQTGEVNSRFSQFCERAQKCLKLLKGEVVCLIYMFQCKGQWALGVNAVTDIQLLCIVDGELVK
jgi:hypothetical protein